MTHKSSHLSQEIYHRIYWYAKRNVDLHVIAHTLQLPFKTVEHIVGRFFSTDRMISGKHGSEPYSDVSADTDATRAVFEHSRSVDEDFLDIFMFMKTRYAVMDVSGMVTKKNINKLAAELEKLEDSDLKAVAISLADVKQVDKDGLGALISLYEKFSKAGRVIAILDPSPAADAFILACGADKKIPVFGTETAFESHAFR
jgi:anti-anti-sigma regulatory factor